PSRVQLHRRPHTGGAAERDGVSFGQVVDPAPFDTELVGDPVVLTAGVFFGPAGVVHQVDEDTSGDRRLVGGERCGHVGSSLLVTVSCVVRVVPRRGGRGGRGPPGGRVRRGRAAGRGRPAVRTGRSLPAVL